MKNYYNFHQDETTLSFSPFYHRYGVSLLYLGISIVTVCLAIIYASPYDRKIWYFFSSVLGIYALYHLIISRNIIYTFDRVHREVTKSYAGIFSRKIITFDKIYTISPMNHIENGLNTGYQYMLSHSDNRFGKQYELSPHFSGDDSEEEEFYEDTLIPAIEEFIDISAQQHTYI